MHWPVPQKSKVSFRFIFTAVAFSPISNNKITLIHLVTEVWQISNISQTKCNRILKHEQTYDRTGF